MNRKEWEDQVFASNMNPTAKMVCIAIGSHGNWTKDIEVRPSKKRIASMVGTSRDTVNKYITLLEEQGWLTPTRITLNNVQCYDLTAPEVAVVYGSLAIKNRGTNVNQVAVTTGVDAVVYDKQVAVTNGQVAVVYDTNLKNLPIEPTIEPTTTTTNADAPVVDEDESSLKDRWKYLMNKEILDLKKFNGSKHRLTEKELKDVEILMLDETFLIEKTAPRDRLEAVIEKVVDAW